MPDPREIDPDDERPHRDADFALWRVYDTGGRMLRLQVRYRDDVEVPHWRDGPDLSTVLHDAEDDGWRVFDREPGNAPGEHAILHLIRTRRLAHP